MLAEPAEEGGCRVWLGGETENPGYDGLPTQFCYFSRDEAPVPIGVGDGGPAGIDHPDCTAFP